MRIAKLLLPKTSQPKIICTHHNIYQAAAVSVEYVTYHSTNGMHLDKFKINQLTAAQD